MAANITVDNITVLSVFFLNTPKRNFLNTISSSTGANITVISIINAKFIPPLLKIDSITCWLVESPTSKPNDKSSTMIAEV